LGECLTEKSGKINLGLEGTLLTGAMTAYAVSYLTGSAWVGVIAAGLMGMVLGGIHGWLCQQPRVNDVAVGIAMIIFGSGIAFFFGKPFIQPQAPQLPSIELGGWTGIPSVQSALEICPLFLVGVAIAPLMNWFFRSTRWGLYVRAVGDSPDAARAMGLSIFKVRMLSIILGSFLMALGVIGFLSPNRIATGGTAGLAIVLHHVINLPIGVLMALVNIPLLLVGLKYLGKRFAIKTIICIGLIVLFVDALSQWIHLQSLRNKYY
jgi:ABC-type uncharacterized transport system permease subunit